MLRIPASSNAPNQKINTKSTWTSSVFGTLVTGLRQRETWQYQYNHLNQTPQCTKASFSRIYTRLLEDTEKGSENSLWLPETAEVARAATDGLERKWSIEKRKMCKTNSYFFSKRYELEDRREIQFFPVLAVDAVDFPSCLGNRVPPSAEPLSTAQPATWRRHQKEQSRSLPLQTQLGLPGLLWRTSRNTTMSLRAGSPAQPPDIRAALLGSSGVNQKNMNPQGSNLLLREGWHLLLMNEGVMNAGMTNLKLPRSGFTLLH